MYLIAPGGSALLVTPDGSLGIQTHPLTHLSASRRDALSKDNKDNTNNTNNRNLLALRAEIYKSYRLKRYAKSRASLPAAGGIIYKIYQISPKAGE